MRYSVRFYFSKTFPLYKRKNSNNKSEFEKVSSAMFWLHFCISQSTLLHLIEEWRTALGNKEAVAVISLDLSEAFDCIPHGLLLAKLNAYGMTEDGVALLRNYLTERLQRVKVGDAFSSWLPVTKAFLRDPSLDPFCLFYLMEGVRINAYADDEQIYESDKDPVKLGMRIQGHLLEADHLFVRF